MANSNKKDKPDKSLLLIAQELKFARSLAGNNKTLRDRTLRKLKKWFDAREVHMPFTEDDFLRVWKGLFYYMWMSDKPLVQEECANNISKLADFQKAETSLIFFKCFLKTMVNEWFGIDYLRLDKFLMLVRRVLRQVLHVLAKTEWDTKNITEFQDILNSTVLQLGPSVPLSLVMHVTEIYLEEVAKVSKGEISEEIVLELTRPFASQLAFTKDVRLSRHVKQYVFRYLIRQSDPGIEYQLKFDAWRQLGFPGGSIDSMEKVEKENDEDNDLPEDDEDNDRPLDPRAGKVHVDLPQLKFNAIKFAEMLEELKFDTKTTTKNRHTLTNLAKNFRVLATGEYPYGLKKVNLKPKNNGESTKIKSSLKRLQRFERSILSNSKKSKQAKLKKKKIREIVKQELEKYKNGEVQKSETLEEFIAKSEDGLLEPPAVKNNKKAPVVATKVNTEKSKKRKLSIDKTSIAKKKFERNSGVWEVDDLDTSTTEPQNTENWITEKSENETPSKKSRTKSKKSVKNGETEIKINGNDIFSTPKSSIKKSKLTTPKSLLKNPFSTPVSSAKKVKIALDLNRSQDHSEYHKSLISSPGIPYDAERKPTKPLLKTRGSLPGAVNPFYKFKS